MTDNNPRTTAGGTTTPSPAASPHAAEPDAGSPDAASPDAALPDAAGRAASTTSEQRAPGTPPDVREPRAHHDDGALHASRGPAERREPPALRASHESGEPRDAPGSADPRAAAYRAREVTFRAEAEREAARSRQLSIARIVLAIVGLAAIVTAIVSPAWHATALLALLAGVTAFIGVAVVHERVERRRRRQAALADLNREAQDRLARAWSRLPEPPPVAVPNDHPYAEDLDLVGHASLLQLIGPPNTPAARRELTGWLLQIAAVEPQAVAARQASVRELAPRLEERQQWQAAGLEARRLDATALDPLLAWAESESWLLPRPWLTAIGVALAIATPLLMVAQYQGWIAWPLWVVPQSLGWLVMYFVYDRLNATFGGASGEYSLRPFEELLALITAARVESPLLVEAHRTLGVEQAGEADARHGHVSASRALGALGNCVALSDLRHQALFYAILQTVFVWDLHVWWLLERWRRQHGRRLRGWLAAVGRVEALAALASLAHDQPDWAFPRVERGQDRIATEGLGHPLLRDDARVSNDVMVGPAGSFLLITGSNMSGKSTLLRAIGLNAILAHAGAPVCARAMTMPPVTLYTSMRVSDSLERGLSLFMASLLRLQRVVEAARHARPAERPLLYLLDEVLQGTNSAERQIAVRTIVGHLIERGALGVVTTHDLELAAAPDFAAAADSRHFTEHVDIVGGEVRMTFDYRLRPGPATSGNALALVRMLGLES